MKARHERLAFTVVGATGLRAASLFLLNAFRSNREYCMPPEAAKAMQASAHAGTP